MTKLNKTTILFDVDGTLFDSVPAILGRFQKVFAKVEEEYPGDEVMKVFLGTDLITTFQDYMPKEKVLLARSIYSDLYHANPDAGNVPLFEGVKEILQFLKDNNLKLGVVTTKRRIHALPVLESVQIDHFFDLIIGSEDVENCKPHPEPLLKAVNIFGEKVATSIYIGDALIDMEAANRADMDFIAVTTGSTSEEAFQQTEQKIILPDLISLKELF